MAPSNRITGEQIRAARALARLDQLDLARISGVSLETIKRLETIRGPVDAHVRTLDAVVTAFLSVGVHLEFFPAVGVRLSGDAQEALTWSGGPDAAAAGHGFRARHAERGSGGAPGRPSVNRIIYRSQLHKADPNDIISTLEDVFSVSLARNARLGVTGALLVRAGRVLQLLEGPPEATREIYGSILNDPRHHSVSLIEERLIGYRRFSEWALLGRDSLIGAREDEAGLDPRRSFRPETLTPARALRLLKALRQNAAGSGGMSAGTFGTDARSSGNG